MSTSSRKAFNYRRAAAEFRLAARTDHPAVRAAHYQLGNLHLWQATEAGTTRGSERWQAGNRCGACLTAVFTPEDQDGAGLARMLEIGPEPDRSGS